MPVMNNDVEQRRCAMRYLLKQMTPEEQADFENQYLADDKLFEGLVATQDEMIRSYLGGKLSEAERSDFENRFLGRPEWRKKINLEESLMNYVRLKHPSSKESVVADKQPSMEAAFPLLGWQGATGQGGSVGNRIGVSSVLRFVFAAACLVMLVITSW